jgi:hypothetical protein
MHGRKNIKTQYTVVQPIGPLVSDSITVLYPEYDRQCVGSKRR